MARPVTPLTDIQCRTAKPKDKPYKMFDGGGLYLQVEISGSKLWRLKYIYQGRPGLMSFGAYPLLSITEARSKRAEAKANIKAGIDPAQDRRRVKREAMQLNSFKALALDWHSKQSPRWTEKHSGQVLNSLTTDIFPIIGNQDPSKIKPAEILEAIRLIEKRGAYEIASRTLQRVNAVFIYGIAIGWCDTNPAQSLHKAVQHRVKSELSYLPLKDLPLFLTKLDAYSGEPQNVLALKLLIHTFLRPGELRKGRWEEIDFDQAVWRVPAERMKMKREHLVPLSQQSLALLNELHMLTGRFVLMFPSRSRIESPISDNTMGQMIKRLGYEVTGHGFRKTASTALNERGFNADAIERQLAHVPHNKIRGIYNKAELLPERQRMMQAWSDIVDGKELNTENVVKLHRKEFAH